MTRTQFEIFEKEFIVGRDQATSQSQIDAINSIIKSEQVLNAYVSRMASSFGVPVAQVEQMMAAGVKIQYELISRSKLMIL